MSSTGNINGRSYIQTLDAADLLAELGVAQWTVQRLTAENRRLREQRSQRLHEPDAPAADVLKSAPAA